MPLTRARQSQPSVGPQQSASAGDDIAMSKTRAVVDLGSARPGTHQRSSSPAPASAHACFSIPSPTKRSMQRTVSSPASLARLQTASRDFVDAAASSTSTSTVSSPTRSSAPSSSASSNSQLSLHARRLGASRRRKSSSATGHDSDSSGDEDERRPFQGRFGGCSAHVEVRTQRDDSNKENVAPVRAVGQAVLSAEAQDAENETVARRTRGRMSLTRMQRTPSSASSIVSVASAPAAPMSAPSTRISTRSSRRQSRRDDGLPLVDGPRTPSSRRRVPVAATVGTPPSSRKRPRPSLDAIDIASEAGDSDCRTPDTPMSRLRLDTCSVISGDDDCGSYFNTGSSAPTSSIFDGDSSAHDSDIFSRATSPGEPDADLTLTPGELGQGKGDTASDSPPPPVAEYSNVYAHARALLRYTAGASLDVAALQSTSSSAPLAQDVEVVGRDRERKALQAFLSQRFPACQDQPMAVDDLLDGNTESGSLYVCGLPGTGKTALVRSIVTEMQNTHSGSQSEGAPVRVAFVNCMSVQHPRQIFVKVMEALGETIKGASEAHIEAEAERSMGKLVRNSGQDGAPKVLVILDEIDHLLHSRAHQNVLYRLFCWASNDNEDGSGSAPSSCALIGIANSLDLTERFVPLLASKGAAPALLHFRPFDSAEIVEVLQSRLRGLKSRYDGEEEDGALPAETSPALFTPAALQLSARKIAAATGDLRKALDAARLAVEIVEGEQRRQALTTCTASGTGTNTEASRLLSHLTPSSAPKVTPQHILKVLSTVLGSPHLTKIRQLGLQAKLMLAAVVIAHQRSAEGMPLLGSKGAQRSSPNGGGPSVADVELTYTAMLRNDGGFTPLETSEVTELFDLLEVQGIISLSSEGADQAPVRAGSSTASTASTGAATPGVSPGGRKAAKRQLLASGRAVRPLVPLTDIHKGITTICSTFAQSQPRSLAATADESELGRASSGASAEALPSQAVADSIKRMLHGEEERIRKSRGWEQVAKERQAVRDAELGGGRLAQVA
ncbi:unnamed protein product [Parajaminaea phylloscopi]